MKKQMEQAAKQMGPMGGMMAIFDEEMILEPLNTAIDMMIESAGVIIEDKKLYPNGKPAENAVVESLEGDHKKSGSNKIEIEFELEQKSHKWPRPRSSLANQDT